VYFCREVYEVRPRKDKRGIDLISDALPFGRLWYDGPNAIRNAVGYARHFSRSHDAVIRVYDATGNVIENAGASERGCGAVSALSFFCLPKLTPFGSRERRSFPEGTVFIQTLRVSQPKRQ
jgi:hypothetical protein